MLSSATGDENPAPATRAYRTTASFAAVHFNQLGKGQIVVLPQGAMLRVSGPSSCLPEGLEVAFEEQVYHVFNADLLARSSQIIESIRASGWALAACA